MSKHPSPPASYSDLRAVFINTTLKPSPEPSHTETLMTVSQHIMKAQGVSIEHIRAVDHVLAPGVQPDMTEHGFARDDWPGIFERVEAADVLVIGSPIWLGERSSTCTRVIERLYAQSVQLNDKGQYVYYGKVGGCIVTGNEDGIKHVAMGVLYALQHLGYTIPPQADAGWIGDAGPGTCCTWRACSRMQAASPRMATRDQSGKRAGALINRTRSTARRAPGYHIPLEQRMVAM